ncbi:MAG: DMT family protein [Chitinophagaceae bacterium]|nr:DMT family protein [Chitinophagaceae bacterium]
MSKYISTIALLFLSNAFMTVAWYGHLKFFQKGEGQPATFLRQSSHWLRLPGAGSVFYLQGVKQKTLLGITGLTKTNCL